ncbi:sulfite exporter TauE/SafE family protein [Cobetia sp. 5-25-4-2]|uniref:sulfite exporter TauE/SafE family protein n=1 Tax=Cobetia sp. 5-25-4-2 TaxID=2737459 RepID=UPI0021005E7E|nr:sulfite exporter TauE/SafE family protein [Cobetia sp. 5-25-4-2]
MEMLVAIVFFSVVGGMAGLAAGLFGIGGGVIIVPALSMALAYLGVDAASIMHLAIGTSLAIIVVTGASSAFGHWKKGAVSLDLLTRMLPGLICGAVQCSEDWWPSSWMGNSWSAISASSCCYSP